VKERKGEGPSALKCCIDALKTLNGELTYESRANAKELLKKAVVLLEKQA
jgi:hypothetical protein